MADDPPLVILGAGGHARVVADALGSRPIIGYLAPEAGDVSPVLGRRLGDDSDAPGLAASGHELVLGLGFVDRPSSARRAAILAALGAVPLATVVHPSATVSAGAALEAGVFVAAGAIVGPGVVVGRGSIINTGAIVDHDCTIGTNVHVGPGATLSGGITVGADTLVGVGATVRQAVRIGTRVVVGAGAVIVADVPDDTTAIGVPARTRQS